RSHSVCRVHASARSGTRARVADDILAALLVYASGQIFTVTLKCRNDVELLAVMGTGANRPTVDHESWPIHAAHSHDASRHILVASGNGNVGVVPLSVLDGFNRIRYQVACL